MRPFDTAHGLCASRDGPRKSSVLGGIVLEFFFCADGSKPLLRVCNQIIIFEQTGIPELQPLFILCHSVLFLRKYLIREIKE